MFVSLFISKLGAAFDVPNNRSIDFFFYNFVYIGCMLWMLDGERLKKTTVSNDVHIVSHTLKCQLQTNGTLILMYYSKN